MRRLEIQARGHYGSDQCPSGRKIGPELSPGAPYRFSEQACTVLRILLNNVIIVSFNPHSFNAPALSKMMIFFMAQTVVSYGEFSSFSYNETVSFPYRTQ